MAQLSEEQKQQIKVIQDRSREITKSKKKASQYLKDSGILDFVKRATKEAKSNGSASESKPEE